MDEEMIEQLNNSYRETIINMEKDNISKRDLGFIESDCSSLVFGLLIHCMENLDIFNKVQLNNIQHFINKIQYGS